MRRERADLVERARRRRRRRSARRAVGRLQPDDAAQRGRLADRAAGVGAERERRHGRRPPRRPSRRWSRPARARDPTGCGSGRRPSSRSTSPSRTRPCWSCRARRAPRPRSGAPRSPCRAADSPRGCASRPSSARRGCTAGPCRRSERPRAGAAVAVQRARAGQRRSASTCRKALSSPSSASMRAEIAPARPRRSDSSRAVQQRARSPRRSCGRRRAPPSCADRRDAEAVRRALGREREQLLARPRRPRHVLAEQFTSSSGCEVGGTSARSSSAIRPMWSRMPARSRARPRPRPLEPDAGEGGGVPHVFRGQAHPTEYRNGVSATAQEAQTLARAACSVLESSIAIVIGPTPPGTGRDRAGDLAARARSRRRRRVPSSVRLMPTSITTAPGLTISAVTKRGRPMAATRTSARRAPRRRSRVRECATVTVQLRLRAAASRSACRRCSSGR